jgi:hypothetical protein
VQTESGLSFDATLNVNTDIFKGKKQRKTPGA